MGPERRDVTCLDASFHMRQMSRCVPKTVKTAIPTNESTTLSTNEKAVKWRITYRLRRIDPEPAVEQ